MQTFAIIDGISIALIWNKVRLSSHTGKKRPKTTEPTALHSCDTERIMHTSFGTHSGLNGLSGYGVMGFPFENRALTSTLIESDSDYVIKGEYHATYEHVPAVIETECARKNLNHCSNHDFLDALLRQCSHKNSHFLHSYPRLIDVLSKFGLIIYAIFVWRSPTHFKFQHTHTPHAQQKKCCLMHAFKL